jgi:hypothetical protein
LEVLELLVASETVLLGHCSVNGDAREVLLHQQLVEGTATRHRANEDHDLNLCVES